MEYVATRYDAHFCPKKMMVTIFPVYFVYFTCIWKYILYVTLFIKYQNILKNLWKFTDLI